MEKTLEEMLLEEDNEVLNLIGMSLNKIDLLIEKIEKGGKNNE